MNRSGKLWCVQSLVIAVAGLWVSNVRAASFSNSTSISLPGPGSSSGSSISVSGLGNSLTSVTVEVQNYTASHNGDVSFVVVGPTGSALVLDGACGGATTASNLNLTFSDAAAAQLSQSSSFVSGTFKPTEYASIGSFPSPGPGSTYSSPAPFGTSTLATTFSGINPNGTWSLYAIDTGSGDTGQISGGWTLQITSVPEPMSAGLFAAAGVCLALRRRR